MSHQETSDSWGEHGKGNRPHFTTIVDFISALDQEIIQLFFEVLLICDEMGLIGKEMFAVDGCKLPSECLEGVEWGERRSGEEKKEDGEGGPANRKAASGSGCGRGRQGSD